jgi:hypothetical protein
MRSDTPTPGALHLSDALGCTREFMREVHVEGYSGYRADERPVRFTLGETTLEITSVEDRWYSPGAEFFRLLASDGNRYILRHDIGQDSWVLEGYRAAK